MKTLVKVARYHLVQPWQYLVVPWGVLTFSFLVSLVVYAMVPADHHTVMTAHGATSVLDNSRYTGASSSFFLYFLVLGIQSIGRSLPFGLTLGISRRTYYTGTALLAIGLAFVNGLALAILQVIEGATNGWGVQMSFFRIAYILNGPWYLTWLSAFVALTLLFVYGMWYGIVHRRWGAIGTIAFIAAQVTVALAVSIVITLAHGWTGVGHFFTSLTAAGLTGLLAVLALVLLTGGHATIRRATI
jgi:hypothetical protein